MKILFDQNLSPKLVAALCDAFPNSVHVRDVNLRDADDWDIWNYAANYDFAVATKDDDFRQRSLVQGHPPKIIMIAVGNCTTARVEQLVRKYLVEIASFEADPAASLIELR
jgi:predicted nuclease of predicted toxin-antitoxin system